MSKVFAAYWLIGCLVVGAADGNHIKRCQNDSGENAVSDLIAVMIWPMGIGAGLVGTPLSPCQGVAP